MNISSPPVEGSDSEKQKHDDYVENLVFVIYLKTHIDCRIKYMGSDVSSPSGSNFWGPSESIFHTLDTGIICFPPPKLTFMGSDEFSKFNIHGGR